MRLQDDPVDTNRRQPHLVRRHPRYMFSIPLTLRHWPPDGFKTSHGMTLDISAGGLAAIVPDTLRVGETVEIELPLPVGLLNTLAKVRYNSENRCGFEFVGLSAQEQQQIIVSVHRC